MSSEERVIMHVDMNSYFASVEQQENPYLRGKPIAVSGRPHIRSVVAAASIEAKKYGVKSGMSTWEAEKLCPSLIFIRGEPEKYIFITNRLLGIFKDYTPYIEIFSIDEVFLDLTNCPFSPLWVAEQIKIRIKREVGEWLTCSIGISHNKLLAKIASESKKPDGLTVVTPSDIPHLLERLDLVDVPGIGEKTKEKLCFLGIRSIKDLANTPVTLLVDVFGVYGRLLKNMSCGIDNSPVVPYFEREEAKSVGHSFTLPHDEYTAGGVKKILMRLSEKVGRRLRNEGLAGNVIHVFVRRKDFSGVGKQRKLSYFTNDDVSVFDEAILILKTLPTFLPTRAVGVSVSGLIHEDLVPISFLEDVQRRERLVKAIDQIKDRFGESVIFHASAMEGFGLERNVTGIRARQNYRFF